MTDDGTEKDATPQKPEGLDWSEWRQSQEDAAIQSLIDELTAERDAARALLRQQEWADAGYCQCCHNRHDEGHALGCEWQKAMEGTP